ncbi:UNVERIFIED_CONTAM: hypothetical protein Sradi_6829000 [Sesamum radiatum]|uniref:DUF4216 domain-containing protein n=1 Tax=Sesamum radiatum TaxID=300843 RepID=A0AAW2JT44_SESRA
MPRRGSILTNCKVVTPYYETYLNKLYQHHHPADPIIDRLVSTEFKDWFKWRVHSELNFTDKELLKCHYWGPSAEVTFFHAYFVNGYNFPIERHNTGKSTMNCGVFVKSSSYADEENDFYGIIEEIIQLTYPLIPNLHIVLFKYRWVDPVRGIKDRRVVDDSKWIETVADQPEEVAVPIMVIDNQSHDLCDPNSVQVVLEAAGTSWRQLHENNEENIDEDEDNGGNDDIDDEEYEAT